MICPRDPKCGHMKVPILSTDIVGKPKQIEQVPRQIYQIWLGPPMPQELQRKAALWQQYASELGYEYTLVTEISHQMKEKMKPANIQHFEEHVRQKQYHGASDILRYELVLHNGGIYSDLDFEPPRHNNTFIDWFTFASQNDLTCCSEHDSRNVHVGSFFCMNGLFSAPPNHTTLSALVNALDENIIEWVNQTGSFDAAYSTGPFLFTRMLQNPFTLIPIVHLKRMAMY